jgi:cellulose synthase/poly-beta-1,6-N-acetylglucosamine synthase-like glycosyltransferase
MFENFEIQDWIIMGTLLLCTLFQVYWYARYLAAPARRLRKQKKATPQELTTNSPTETPGVSVILSAHNESDNLAHYLQALLTQDYPEYEVIVVDDGSEDSTREIIERYSTHDPRLHMTFVPYGARIGSTKKLALTLAAKAAKYDFLLLTDADCVPASNHWISEMMAGFGYGLPVTGEGKDLVLGFSPYFETQGHVNRLIRFDTLFNGLHYLGAALCRHPYMGVGRNLAYRKSLFFKSGGFTRQMTSRAGDDDLFVNHVATPANTAVVLSRDSFVWSPAKQTFKEWWQQKRRHLSVSPSYKPSTKFRLTVEPLTRGLFYAAVIAAVILSITNYQSPITSYQLPITNYQLPILPLLAVALFLFRWILQTALINVSARRMGLRRFSMFTILWFDIVLPLVNLWMLIVPQRKLKW